MPSFSLFSLRARRTWCKTGHFGQLLEQLPFLGGERLRHSDADLSVEVPRAAPGIWETLALEPNLAARGGPRRELDVHRAIQHDEPHLSPQGRFPRRDRHRGVEVTVLQAERWMGQDLDQQIQIAWWTTDAFFSLSSQADTLSRPDTFWNVDHVSLVLSWRRAAQRDLTL